MRIWIVMMALALRLFSASPYVDSIINLPAGTWYGIPGTHMKDVMRTDMGPTVALMGAWSGGVYDPVGRRMLIWGGGLGNYRGNEFYSFSLDSMKWERLNEPCVTTGCCDPDPCGTAMTRHTYSGMAFITHANRFFVNGGARNCGAAGACGDRVGLGVSDAFYMKKTWTFDPAAKQWHLMYRDEATRPDSGDGPGTYMQTCAYDSVTRKVFYACTQGTYTYEFDANQWVQISTARSTNSQGSLIDYKRRRFVRIGAYGNWDPLAVHDLTQPGYPMTEYQTTGDTAIMGRDAIGADYDPIADRYVCWRENAVYSLDPDTWAWTRHDVPNAPATTPNGIYGRWRYIPHLNAYVCVTSDTGNVHFFKFTAGDGSAVENKAGRMPGRAMGLRATPNPFNPATRISFSRAVNGQMTIYDTAGRTIARLAMRNGSAEWKPDDGSSGLYVAELRDNGKVYRTRIALVK